MYCCALLTQLGCSTKNSNLTEIQTEWKYFSVPVIMNSAFENWQIMHKEGTWTCMPTYIHECIQLCYRGLCLLSLKVKNWERLVSRLYSCQTRVNSFSTCLAAWYIVLIEMRLIVNNMRQRFYEYVTFCFKCVFCLLLLVWCSVFTPFWPVEPQKKEELQASNWWHVYFLSL